MKYAKIKEYSKNGSSIAVISVSIVKIDHIADDETKLYMIIRPMTGISSFCIPVDKDRYEELLDFVIKSDIADLSRYPGIWLNFEAGDEMEKDDYLMMYLSRE